MQIARNFTPVDMVIPEAWSPDLNAAVKLDLEALQARGVVMPEPDWDRAVAEANAVGRAEHEREVGAGRMPSAEELASNPGLRLAMGLDVVEDDCVAPPDITISGVVNHLHDLSPWLKAVDASDWVRAWLEVTPSTAAPVTMEVTYLELEVE